MTISMPRLPTGSMRRDGSLADRPDAAEATRGSPRYASPMWSITTRFGLGTDRLRDRGMLTKAEAANRLGIHEATLVRWAQSGLVIRHAYNAHAYLYEVPDRSLPPSIAVDGIDSPIVRRLSNSERLKIRSSNRRRCSVKTVGCRAPRTRNDPTRGSSGGRRAGCGTRRDGPRADQDRSARGPRPRAHRSTVAGRLDRSLDKSGPPARASAQSAKRRQHATQELG